MWIASRRLDDSLQSCSRQHHPPTTARAQSPIVLLQLDSELNQRTTRLLKRDTRPKRREANDEPGKDDARQSMVLRCDGSSHGNPVSWTWPGETDAERTVVTLPAPSNTIE